MLNKIYQKFQKIIKYKFNNFEILVIALTHKSYAIENGKKDHNERMEFLGDSILAAIVADILYSKYPYENEGKLSKLKSQIVSSYNLSIWAKDINLSDYILLGNCEMKRIEKQKNLLCDAFEAIIGGIYLDGGLEKAKRFIVNFFQHQKKITLVDYKSKLQEIVQSSSIYRGIPDYKILREIGPAHNKEFDIAVYVNGNFFGKGRGSSKKEAQQFAAKQAIENIDRFIDMNTVV
ncbi:MAG: ribonuclease III [Endomicrobium sp.]|jgi:ribonuclease-3|nr:ribonuclease III [Endomicrobium sp.]